MTRVSAVNELTWRAQYDDGRQLSQLAPDGTRHKYQDIERERLVCFDLWRGERLLVRVDMRDDSGDGMGPKRLIWRIRTELTSRGATNRVHMAGWQRTVKGRNVQAIAYVFEDGAVVLGGQFQENDPLMYDVVELDCER